MKTINFGPGLAPDVRVSGGLVWCAYGTHTDGLQLVVLNAFGEILERNRLDGFYNSWPRFGGDWVVFKGAPPNFAPSAINVRTGEARIFSGRVDGNFGIVTDGHLVAWQTDPGLRISQGTLADGFQVVTNAGGAPDGLETLTAGGGVTFRKDISMADPAVGGYPQRAGDLVVGQYGYGTGIRFDGDVVRWLLGDSANQSDTADPRCATDGTTYAVASWGNRGVRLTIGTKLEFQALPLPPSEIPDPPPPPPPADPPREEPPVSTPSRFDVVQSEWAKQPARPNDSDSCGEFTRRVAWALNPSGDPNGWGLLSKSAGEGHYEAPNHPGFLTALDALIFAPTQQVIDIIGGAEGPNPQPGWMEVPKRDSNNWVAPRQPMGTSEPPPPPPPPPPFDVDRLKREIREETLQSIATAIAQLDLATLRADVNALKDRPVNLPSDVVRESTHQVRTALRLSSPLVGTIVRK